MNNKKYRPLLVVISLLMMISVFSGCSQNKEETTDSKAVDNSSEKNKEIKIAYNPGLGNVLGFIAKEKGYDAEEGMDFQFVEFSNTTDALTALRSKKVDLGVSWGTSAPLILMTKGAEFGIIGGHENGGMPVYANQDFEYEGLESFLGKRIAGVRMYTPDIVWRSAMEDAGYDLENDLELMEFKKPSEALEAVKAGNADVFIGTNSTYPQAMKSGLKVIANSSDFWNPTHVGCRVVGNISWIEENEDLAKGFMKTYIKAEKVIKEDPEFAVKVQMDSTGVEEEYARAQVLETQQIFQSDPLTDGIFYNYDKLLDLGYIEPSDIDLNKHLIVKYYKQALDELVEENPEDSFYKNLIDVFAKNNTKIIESQGQ